MSAYPELVGEVQERPASVHAETTILGAMLVEPLAIPDAMKLLVADDFALDSHRRIFTAIARLTDAGNPVDIVTVAEEMRRTKELDSINGVAYLASLSDGLPRRLNIESYVRIVRDKSLMRQLMEVCEGGMLSASDQGEEAIDVLNAVTIRLQEISNKSETVKKTHISQLVVPAWEEVKRQREHTGEVLGIPTGIAELDQATSGWRDGEMTYVGALPGRGKTSFMLQCVLNAAREGFGIGVISLEMRSLQLMRRLAILNSRVSAQRWRDPRVMGDMELHKAKQGMFALGDLPIDICDQSGLKPMQISAMARQMVKDGAKAIFVDFVQIIREDGTDRREAINRVSASLRDTCKALNVPFIVASQLARRDANPNRKPTLQDLRESGNLEQDCHNAFFLFRPKDERGEWNGEDEIIIEKQREGFTGIVKAKYDDTTLSYTGRQ
jgi:replicative DNA helicase